MRTTRRFSNHHRSTRRAKTSCMGPSPRLQQRVVLSPSRWIPSTPSPQTNSSRTLSQCLRKVWRDKRPLPLETVHPRTTRVDKKAVKQQPTPHRKGHFKHRDFPPPNFHIFGTRKSQNGDLRRPQKKFFGNSEIWKELGPQNGKILIFSLSKAGAK